MKNRHRQVVIDGEAVLLGADGVSDFNGLRSGEHNDQVQLYALEGEDPRALPLSMRKTNLAPAVCASTGRHLRFEQGEIGPDLFRAACNTGPEGIVSKRADRPYRAGRSRD